MNKAVIVGGSNGIGLAVGIELIKIGYAIHILDINPPGDGLIEDSRCGYTYCNVEDFDEALFEKISADCDVRILMITAGIGRVADFEYLHTAEIEKLLKINTVAVLKIIRVFYDRVRGQEPFYLGVMGSIAGLVSSPMFSVYAASKAAVFRFVESVNVELEVHGCKNRILNVSPGSIQGTRFNGGENDLSQTQPLAGQIVDHLLRSAELFIPAYDEVYKGVLDRYRADAHAFGISSYQYKLNAGRAMGERRVKIGYLSGTFDLFHVGHLRLLERAKRHCDYLIVGVHPDASHKGKETFIPFEERKAILAGSKYVDRVVDSCREDSEAWNRWHYDRLFVGDDYKGSERFIRYERFFADKGVEIIYFPYTEGTNSTQIRKAVLQRSQDVKREP